ncbi:MAG: glutaredoxin domain-containing protein [Bacteroidota bacterium]
MNRFFLITCVTFFLNFSHAQVAVQILEEETDAFIAFYAKNTIDEPVEITFQLSEVIGLDYDGSAIVKLVEPGKKEEVVKLQKTKPQIAFTYDYHQVLMPSKGYDEAAFEKFETGIVVFSIDGCSRCTYATDYLNRNKVDFTLLNFSQNPVYGEYMWDKLRAQGYFSKRVQTPVIMVNGEISHSHDNLKQFVKKLKG